ncbi:CRE-CLEC-62 protein [Caenorhabditis remanei]|uniref:CRE-CLEC-62 protein n=1 Tax=Caenorhabditis remanei TaxID=31234 RepID=E3MXH4_CAERE|nr:CRE-CLEC-62 protein [Caenorhabditis remanei]
MWHLVATYLLLLTTLSIGSAPPTDRDCGHDLINLWLDVVVVVDNSIGMTQAGLTEQADLNRFQSADDLFNSVFSILPHLSSSDEVYLAKGIAAAEQVLTAGRKNNTRSNYKQFVLIYASAYNDDGMGDPRPIAERLKTSGVNIATVAFDQTGDQDILKAIGEIASPGFNFTNKDEDLVGEVQAAMVQTNCYCSNSWHQYRDQFGVASSQKYGVCLRPVAITAGWTPAKFACQNMIQMGYMVTEYNQKKHDFVFKLIQNDTSFPEPYIYHIGLSYVNGGYYWQQPVGHALVPVNSNDSFWNPGFPQQSSTSPAVLNQQASSVISVGWQNVNQFTVAERYVCEVSSCDTENYCE